jgi:hypothetical protein
MKLAILRRTAFQGDEVRLPMAVVLAKRLDVREFATFLQDQDGALYAGLYSRDYEAAFGDYEIRCRSASSVNDPGREISEVKL